MRLTNKSTGLDDIPAWFLNNGASKIKETVMYIIYKSISIGILPEDLKKGRVKPLFKIGNSLEVGNYRPVSTLCIISKILKKMCPCSTFRFFNQQSLIVFIPIRF